MLQVVRLLDAATRIQTRGLWNPSLRQPVVLYIAVMNMESVNMRLSGKVARLQRSRRSERSQMTD